MWFFVVAIFTHRFEIAKQSIIIFAILCLFILLTFFIPICLIQINDNAFLWLFDFILQTDTRVRY